MKKIKRFLPFILIICFSLILTACSKPSEQVSNSSNEEEQIEEFQTQPENSQILQDVL